MVFESLVNPIIAEKKPWEMVFIGVIYSSIAIILSLYIFAEYASLVMIFLTVLAAVPLMYSAVKMEEKKDLEFPNRLFLLKQHARALSFFMFLFLGFVISFSVWYIALPQDVTDTLFTAQHKEIQKVEQAPITGNAVSSISVFGNIFFNNLMVMVFALLFAFFYGVGAIFILTWNASVLGTAIGIYAHRVLSDSVWLGLPLGFGRYMLHGIPEMLAYFMAGLAGSIISIAVIRHDFGSGRFKAVLTDSLDLTFLAVLVLLAAAGIEVFVTPLIF